MIAEEMTPREIVTRLHVLIAAKSPDRAALVAAYQETRAASRVPPGPPRRTPSNSGPRWLRRYAELRDAGLTPKAAAARMGICPRTKVRYESALKGGRT